MLGDDNYSGRPPARTARTDREPLIKYFSGSKSAASCVLCHLLPRLHPLRELRAAAGRHQEARCARLVLVNYGIQSRGLIFHDTLISCSRAWCPAADAVATLATFYYSCRSHEVRKCHVSRVTRGGRVTRVPALFCHHLGTRHQYTSHFYLGLTGVEEVRCDWVSLPDFSDFSVPWHVPALSVPLH